MNKAHPPAPYPHRLQATGRPRGAFPRALPHDRARHLLTRPHPTLLAALQGAADGAPLHSPPAPGHTPHGRTFCLRSRTSHSGTHVAIASFYGKCRDRSTIESRRHDSSQAAASDRKSIPSPHGMCAIHGHTLHSPKPARQVESAREPNAACCPHTLLAHRRANAPAPAATPVLKGRKPATSKQT